MSDVDDYSLKGKQSDIDFILNNHKIHGDYIICAYVFDEDRDTREFPFRVYKSKNGDEIYVKGVWSDELYTVEEFAYYYDFYHRVFDSDEDY